LSDVKPSKCREEFPEYGRVEDATRPDRRRKGREVPLGERVFDAPPGDNPVHAVQLAEEEACFEAFCERNERALSRFHDPDSSSDVRRRAAEEVLRNLRTSKRIEERVYRRCMCSRIRARAS